VFETALLLALREKELGLDAVPWIDRARALATPDTATYIDMVTSIAWTTVANAPDFEPPARPEPGVAQQWLDFLNRPGATSTLDRYVWLALTCGGRGGPPVPDSFVADRPILQYRLGLCGFAQRAQLDTVFAASPRFAETGFYLARYEMANTGFARAQITRALPLLLDAHAALPASPIITVTLGRVWAARNEFARALTLYDEAIAIRPAQRDALLGRATMLTYLGQPEEAIAAATQLIELGTWYLGDAYYWRAWNLYNTGRLQPAAEDVASARKFQNGGELLTLSGMIAYDQKRPVDARRDFERARALNSVNCPATWYLGVINVDERRLNPAREMFATASTCYRAALDGIAMEVLAPDLSPQARQQQEQDRARRIADNERQEARSALNVALLSMQAGDPHSAERYARIALGHDFTRERAQGVIDRIAASSAPSTRPTAPGSAAPSPATSATPASPR
jgi:tetratricopeptide (TPR) repeat protein